MKNYKVVTYEITEQTRYVEAENESEAKELAENGEGEFMDTVNLGGPDKTRTTCEELENEKI